MGALFLLVIVVYSVFGITLIVKTKGWRMKLVAAAALALLPTFDILLAQAYMYYRCAQDGGMRVYETVQLRESDLVVVKSISGDLKKNRKYFQDPKWDMYRQLSCEKADNYKESGLEICKQLPQRYSLELKREELAFGVDKDIWRYSDQIDGKSLGELIRYGHRNSWFISMFGFSGWGWSCPPGKVGDISVLRNSIIKIAPGR